jgi:hypothetical protein
MQQRERGAEGAGGMQAKRQSFGSKAGWDGGRERKPGSGGGSGQGGNAAGREPWRGRGGAGAATSSSFSGGAAAGGRESGGDDVAATLGDDGQLNLVDEELKKKRAARLTFKETSLLGSDGLWRLYDEFRGPLGMTLKRTAGHEVRAHCGRCTRRFACA